MDPRSARLARSVLLTGAVFALIVGVPTVYARNWPPAVIVQSSSMMHADGEAGFGRLGTMDVGDLVLVKSVGSPDDVATFLDGARGSYDAKGDVIVYYAGNDRSATPIIHRAMAYVDVEGAGDARTYRVRWDPAAPCEGDAAKDPDDPRWCVFGPQGILAPSAGIRGATGGPFVPNADGFITKGDNPLTNGQIDPVAGISKDAKGRPSVVEPAWIEGKARGELPWIGLVKLALSGSPNEDRPPASYVRVGSAYAPGDLWVCLALTLGLVVGGPLAYDGWTWWRGRRLRA